MRVNRQPNASLRDDAAFIFGVRPSLVLSVGDLQFLSVASGITQVALLIGTGFDNLKDTIYINGMKIDGSGGTTKTFKSSNLYEVKFPVSADDTLKVTVVQDNAVVSKSVPNPAALKITSASVLSCEPAVKNKPGVMIVKIQGTGFSPRILPGNITGARLRRLEFVSSTELILRLLDPEPPIVIRLSDPVTRGLVSTVIESLPAQAAQHPLSGR